MTFYFYGRYINIDTDEKAVKRDIITAVAHFLVLVIVMNMMSEKIILKIYSVISR